MLVSARALQEGLQMLREDLVERVLFWLTAAVWARLRMGTRARHGAGRAATCSPVGADWLWSPVQASLWDPHRVSGAEDTRGADQRDEVSAGCMPPHGQAGREAKTDGSGAPGWYREFTGLCMILPPTTITWHQTDAD